VTFVINGGLYCKSWTCCDRGDENQVEKRLKSLRHFTGYRGKTKFCTHCGRIATQEALFEVDGASLIEKYCDICVKKIK
jgi:hypothetical protein